jgi:hypothetical protein
MGMIMRDGVKPKPTTVTITRVTNAQGLTIGSRVETLFSNAAQTTADMHAQQASDWLKLREWDEAMKDAGWRDMAPKPTGGAMRAKSVPFPFDVEDR